MATWEYTEFKLKHQIGFILRNFENLHTHKGPYVGLSNHWAFPPKPKPTEVPQKSLATAAALPQGMGRGVQVVLYAEDWMKTLIHKTL